MSAEPLNLAFVNEKFQNSLKEDNDVDIEEYMNGYNELTRFLDMIGTVFSFVSSDVRSKMKVMDKHRESDDKINYDTFRRMMKFEKDSKLFEKSNYVSGSRTMLRLHRGLDFIRLFLKRIGEAPDDVNICSVCQMSYGESLSQFHPWYIRKAASLAMHALPSRADLMRKIFGSEDCQRKALEILPDTLNSCDLVYLRVEQLYTEFDFHNLA